MAQFCCRLMFPLPIGAMDVYISSKMIYLGVKSIISLCDTFFLLFTFGMFVYNWRHQGDWQFFCGFKVITLCTYVFNQ